MKKVTLLSRAFGILAAAGALFLGLTGAATAGVIFEEDLNAPNTLHVVRFNPAFTMEGPANFVTGRVDGDGALAELPIIEFRSLKPLRTDNSPQVIRSDDPFGIQNFSVQLEDGVFDAFFFNTVATLLPGTPGASPATITVFDTNGTAYVYEEILTNNNNRLLITATDGTLFTRVEFSTVANISALSGLRIGGLEPSPVPEPGALWILGAGLLGMSLLRRSKRT